jgi:anti-sigma factor RsiW
MTRKLSDGAMTRMKTRSPSLHPPQGELELYVMGALEAGPAGRIERHVRACQACAAALAEEARIETTLRAIVPRVQAEVEPPSNLVRLPTPSAPSAPATRASRSSALAAAAALLLGVWGLSADRLDHAGERTLVPDSAMAVASGREGEGAALVCLADGSDALCRVPLAVATMAPASLDLPTDAVCRAPAGGVCSIQSRMP